MFRSFRYDRLDWNEEPRSQLLVHGDRSTLDLVLRQVLATGRAENDIQQASALARQMVTRWGMSDELGPVTLAPRDDLPAGFGMSKPYSEATARSIDIEVQRMLRESHAEAVRLLEQYRPQLDALAEALLEHETLDEQEILKVTGLPRAPRLHDRPIPIRAAAFRRPA